MPYSHYVLAQTIAKEAKLPVKDRAEYLLGAFMPDIRYFTQQPRDKYHFSVDRLEDYRSQDVSADYLLGYKVHLLIDEVWEYPAVKEAYREAFPVVLRKRLTRGLQALAFELYCLKQPADSVTLSPIENELTESLEIPVSDIERSAKSMQRYLERRDLEAALVMAKETKLFPEERLQTVERVVKVMKNPLVGPVVYTVIKRASRQTFSDVVTHVLERLRQEVNENPALRPEHVVSP